MRNTKKNVLGFLLAVLLVGATAVTASAHTTQATPYWDYCYYQRVCLAQHHNNGGGRAFYTGSDGDYFYDLFNNSTSLDNNVSYIYNNGSSCTVYLREGYDFGGWQFATGVGQAFNLLSINDQASSHHWCTPS